MAAGKLSGGFADPVHEAQAAFRTIMDAMARPGRPRRFALAVTPPAPLTRELAAFALTLLDHETTLWLAPPLRDLAEVRSWLAFHTGAPVAAEPGEADFALASDPRGLPPPSAFRRGTAEYPDLGATVAVQVPGFAGGDAVRLTGPGIETETVFAPEGLPGGWWRELLSLRPAYPLGIDVVFLAPGEIAGLPRATRIEILEEAPCMSR